MAPFRLSRAVLPVMRAQGSGVIVNVSSFTTWFEGQPGLALYCLSKIALSHLSESMNAELEGTGVRVVAVEPGPFATDIYPANRLDVSPASPYAELVADVDRAVADLVQAAEDPAIAARAIVDVAGDISVTGRVLLGEEAVRAVHAHQQQLIAMWRSSTED